MSDSRRDSQKSRSSGIDLPTPSPQLYRSASKNSDSGRTHSFSFNTLPLPPHIEPEPAYIAPSAAAHVVTSGLANRTPAAADEDDFDEDPAAAFSTAALALLNNFLDQLLYSFLASSRSTSILSLRPAISEILKPRLAKEAIDGADDELKGYMAGGDDEELLDFHNGQELKGGSNLHHIFRRTRLRCMVYTRLGDMEEDDEEAYLEAESPGVKVNRLSRDFGNVSPAAAIFLTSVIEFIGEQALMIAGENAVTRTSSARQANKDRLVVEDRDVEKIAFNKTLGRLWRSWKKAGRTTSMVSPRPTLYDTRSRKTVSEGASRATSISEQGEHNYFDARFRRSESIDGPAVSAGRKVPPKAMNLPEEPDFGDMGEETAKPIRKLADRPRSMVDYKFPNNESLPEQTDQDGSPGTTRPRGLVTDSTNRHRRASSLPPVKSTPYSSPVEENFATPTEQPDSATDTKEPPVDEVDDKSKHTEDRQDPHRHAHRKTASSSLYDGMLHDDPKSIPIDPMLSSRGASMSEYSDDPSYVNDAEMTPQALKFKKAAPFAGRDDHLGTSFHSATSSGYSFHAGEQSPRQSTEADREKAAESSDDVESGIFPAKGPSKEKENRSFKDPQHDGRATTKVKPLETFEGNKVHKRDASLPQEAASKNDAPYAPKASPRPGATIMDSSDLEYGDAAAFEAVHGHPGPVVTNRVEPRKPPTSAPTSAPAPSSPPGAERAAVQRIQPSPTSREPPTYAGRVSSSSNRDARSVTSAQGGSGVSSKLKGIMGRDSSDGPRHAVVRGTSADITREVTGGSSRSGGSNKEQDFEQLMQSKETVKYTLTPQSMREIEVSRPIHLARQMLTCDTGKQLSEI